MKPENVEVLSDCSQDITKENNFTGVIRGTRSRYGFLKISGQNDIFIKPQEMDKVFSGDVVEVEVKNYKKDNQYVVIKKILKSDKKIFLGLFSEDETGAYVMPDDYGFNRKIRIPKSFKMNARNNQYVKIELIEHPFKSKKPKAKVIEVIGDKNCWNIQADYNLSKHSVDSYVSNEIVEHCNDLVAKTNSNTLKLKNKRKDLTKIDFFTIDGENTIDIDDAIYVQKLKDKWKLLVAISDVSEFIEENTPVDLDAYRRMSTVYLVGKTIPMLANEITDILSLKAHAKRFVIVADITINLDGSIEKHSFYEAAIQSKAKLSYNEVDIFLDTGEIDSAHDKIKNSLKDLKELQELLLEFRVNNNVLPPNREDYRNFLNFNRKIENICKIETNKSHRMVEEAMLCANKCAADFVSNSYGEAIYKGQAGVQNNKISALTSFLNDYIDIDRAMLKSFDGFKMVMARIEEHEYSDKLKSVVNNCLKDSYFSETADVHTSMGFDNYTYFTSPIRRYPDIIIHRIIKSKIRKKKYQIQKDNYIEHFRNKSIAINKCVSETERWMQADYLNALEKNTSFEATVIGVTSSFLSVKLNDSGITGQVFLNKLSEKGSKPVLSKMNVTIGKHSFLVSDIISVKINKIREEDNSVVFELV